MPTTLASLIGLAFVLCVCAVTGLVGGVRERLAAAVTACGVLASLAVQRVSGVWDPVLALGAVDVAVLVAFIALAWRPRWGWPVWAVGFQGVTVAIDVLRAASPHMAAYTYLTAITLSTYGVTATIAYAGWASRRSER